MEDYKTGFAKLNENERISESFVASDLVGNENVDGISPLYDLKKIYNSYEQEVHQINLKYQAKETVIRTIFFVTPILISIPLIHFLKYFSFLVWGISAALSTLTLFLRQYNSKNRNEINDAKVNFLLKYKCPNCQARIGDIHWRLLEDQKVCNICRVSFLKRKQNN